MQVCVSFQLASVSTNGLYVYFKVNFFFREHKANLKEILKAWETKFNAVYTNCKPKTVENDVDLEAPPENFKWVMFM